jgi:FHS family Na+ dependent glucose MFS transporter 1
MVNKIRNFTRNDAIRRTFGYYSLFICLGLGFAITGPTLGALGLQTHTGKGEMGLLFLASSIGYTLGTLVSGRIFDHVLGHPILGAAEIFVAAMLVLIPLTPWLWVLLVVMACMGFAGGFVNTGANILLVWTHGEKVGPFMNGLHFFFGLGATLSPFLVGLVMNISGGYRYAYWIMAAFALLVGLRMVTLKGSPQPTHSRTSEVDRPAGSQVPYGLIIAAMLYLFFYVGSEITFGGWLYTYAVTLDLASAAGAAYLTSAFWFSFTAGRLLSIPAATRFSPVQVILAASIGCLSILALGMLFSGSSTALWLMAIGLGFCMAPIWPTGFTLAGQSVNLTGRLAGVILLGDSFGGMVLPTLVGKVIETSGPPAMIYLVFGSLVLTLLAFAGMLRFRPLKAPSFSS